MREGSGAKRPRLDGRWVATIWAIAIPLAWFGLGAFLEESLTGIVFPQRSLLAGLVSVLLVLVALGVTIEWTRRRMRERRAHGEGRARREFLLGAGSALGGLVGVGAAAVLRNLGWMTVTGPNIAPPVPTGGTRARPEWKGARIVSYRRLGRTGFDVSDISLGSARIRGEVGERIAREAIERGVNYFDTAPDYSAEGSELALGRAMKGYRDRMFVATKFCTPHGHLQAGASVRQYMEVVEASLRRLQTDYVDLVHIHACDTLDRLLDPNVHEAFQRLRDQGKARFLGFSSHTPHLEQVAEAAIEDGRFDVMMLAYHHGAWPNLGRIIERAAAKNIGVVAMKTLKGAKHRGLLERRPEGDTFPQAAFKWVLANPNVSCLVISFFQPEHVDEYLYASGKKLTESDLALLERYDRLIAGTWCRPHCGECLDACPENLPINDILRYRMYFEDYGDEKEAMRLYARLERNAQSCLGCPAPCAGTCPEGIPIRERLLASHHMLTLTG